MKINRAKSGIMFYKKKKSKVRTVQILGYPVVENYKYLGIWIDEKFSFEKQYLETKAKIEKGTKLITKNGIIE